MASKLLKEYIDELIVTEQVASVKNTAGDKSFKYTSPEPGEGISGMIFTKDEQKFKQHLDYAWKVMRAPSKVRFFLKKVPKTDMLKLMFPKSARVQMNVESGEYSRMNSSRAPGSEPRLPSVDMWDAAVYDLDKFYNLIASFQSLRRPELVLETIAKKLNATWRPSFKKAYKYLAEAPDDKKEDLNKRMNKVYRVFYLNLLKDAKKAFTKEYPRDVHTYAGKRLGNLKKLYGDYVNLFK